MSLPNFSNRKTGIPLSPFKDVPSPVFIWGSPYGNRDLFILNPCMETGFPHFHMGMCRSPFPYGDPHIEMFLAAKILAMRWCLVRDSMASQNYSPCFHTESPHMETRRPTKKFPFGDSPLPNRVCDHMGINMYVWQYRLSCQCILTRQCQHHD